MKVGIFGFALTLGIMGGLSLAMLAGCKKTEPSPPLARTSTDDGKIYFQYDRRLFVCNPNVTIQQIADDSNLGVEAFVCITEKK